MVLKYLTTDESLPVIVSQDDEKVDYDEGDPQKDPAEPPADPAA